MGSGGGAPAGDRGLHHSLAEVQEGRSPASILFSPSAALPTTHTPLSLLAAMVQITVETIEKKNASLRQPLSPLEPPLTSRSHCGSQVVLDVPASTPVRSNPFVRW